MKKEKKKSLRSAAGPAEGRTEAERRDFQRKIVDQVMKLGEPLCEAEGMELIHVEYQREPGGRTLRIYLDKPGGVTLDDCVHVSRQLGDLLDVYLEGSASYRLEVSSPGPDRPLGKMADFEKFKGNTAKLKIYDSPGEIGQGVCLKKKSITGVLLGISEDRVELMAGDQKIAVPYRDIAKARLVNYNGENRC